MLRDEAMVGGAHGGGARTPQPGAPAVRAPIEGARRAEGTVIDRLASIHNGRLGNLLNQLQVRTVTHACIRGVQGARLTAGVQILGVDAMHLNRIKVQLTTALGDDSGKQFRVLQKAIEQIVKDKSLGLNINPHVEEHDDSYKPEDLERLVRTSAMPVLCSPCAALPLFACGADAPRARCRRQKPRRSQPTCPMGGCIRFSRANGRQYRKRARVTARPSPPKATRPT